MGFERNILRNHFPEPKITKPGFKSYIFKHLSNRQVASLQEPFYEEEIKKAVWNCADEKVPGPDGFTFAFIKAHWGLIKPDILRSLKEFENFDMLLKGTKILLFSYLYPKWRIRYLLSITDQLVWWDASIKF